MEWRRGSRVDEVQLINDPYYHGVWSHDDLDILGLSCDTIDPDWTGDVAWSAVEVESWGCIQMPVDWWSMSSSNLYSGVIHVVAFGGLGMGSVISDLSIGNVGVLSWVVVSLFVIFISWSQVSHTSCTLTCSPSLLVAAALANCLSLHVIH